MTESKQQISPGASGQPSPADATGLASGGAGVRAPGSWYRASDGEVHMINVGLCYATVCAPDNMDPAEIQERVRRMDAAGTSSGWLLCADARFATGEPNPCPCEKEAGRVHRLFAC